MVHRVAKNFGSRAEPRPVTGEAAGEPTGQPLIFERTSGFG